MVAIWCKLWSKAGHFNKALSKGPKTTTWIFNLHADAHDFHVLNTSSASSIVFSSNLAHLSLVFFWLAGMHFHGAYFSIERNEYFNSSLSWKRFGAKSSAIGSPNNREKNYSIIRFLGF